MPLVSVRLIEGVSHLAGPGVIHGRGSTEE
jgi:hypothetical protein